MEKYVIYSFSSKCGKGSIAVNMINYSWLMTEFINSLKDYHQVKLLLRVNMENLLERQKAYIIEAMFTRRVLFWTGNYITRSRFDPCYQKIQYDLTFTSFIFENKITGILAIVEMIRWVEITQRHLVLHILENIENLKS